LVCVLQTEQLQKKVFARVALQQQNTSEEFRFGNLVIAVTIEELGAKEVD